MQNSSCHVSQPQNNVKENMRSVLITGGTGFFGRAFVKKLLDDNLCERICVFSRGEYAQALMRDSLNDDTRMRWFIGDVRDRDRLRRAMTGVDVVIHAAALKRIEVGRFNPIEMIRTNVDGAVNIIEAAQDAGVRKVVYLSSDKAAEGISCYGQSKALAESLFLAANDTVNQKTGPFFIITRYGNVWNSTGSIVPRWHEMIKNGATSVPVSDPECTRFFMRANEAVELVLDAIRELDKAFSGQPWKKMLIPSLPAYRIGDLAQAMGVDMDIYGLPEYEKLHEIMEVGKSSVDASRLSVQELRYELDLLDD